MFCCVRYEYDFSLNYIFMPRCITCHGNKSSRDSHPLCLDCTNPCLTTSRCCLLAPQASPDVPDVNAFCAGASALEILLETSHFSVLDMNGSAYTAPRGWKQSPYFIRYNLSDQRIMYSALSSRYGFNFMIFHTTFSSTSDDNTWSNEALV